MTEGEVQKTQFITIGDLPEKFYNERKKNRMVLDVSLTDGHGNIVTGKYVELQATLLYENGGQVFDQNKLVSKNVRTVIDRTGRSLLYFRIEDVSQNHGKKNFVVKLSPVKPEHADIADGFTTPVFTMSKAPEDRYNCRARTVASLRKKRKDISPSTSSDSDLDEAYETEDPRPMKSARSERWGDYSTPSETDFEQPMVEVLADVLREYHYAISTLEEMRWKCIGKDKEKKNDIYNMNNPNTTIDRLVS
ncbi:unnamed protein product, partial [Symbiodinium microadriaticum]